MRERPGMYDPETGGGIRPGWLIGAAIAGAAIWALAIYGAVRLFGGCG